MSITTAVINKSKARTPLAALINDNCPPIGGIFRLDYHSAVVLTDDYHKHEAGGVPQGGYLLAAAGNQTDDGFVVDDEELILLRVRGTAPLPNEADLVQTRLAVVRDAATTGRGFDDVTDVLTRNELQQSAFDCEVLGTFYLPTDGSTRIEFGADIDNVVSSAKYQVFLPSQNVLSWLASYPESESDDDLLTLGVVRFSSTLRRARAAGIDNAEIRVHVGDFVSRKTAVFGMTRTGKSNTIKTLVTAIYRLGIRQGLPIGQLIFDPQGEYANINDQDKTGLRLLGDTADQVRIYKMSPKSDPREQPLRINFLDSGCLATVWEMVQEQVASGVSSNAQYMAGFRSVTMNMPDPSDIGARNHFERNRLAFYALLDRAGVSGSLTGVQLTLTNDLVTELTTTNPPPVAGITGTGKVARIPSTSAAAELLAWLREKDKDNKLTASWHNDFANGELGDILKAMEGRAGDAAVKRIRPFHDTSATGDIGDRVWDDMQAGRLVIVDLSQGNDTVAKSLSERIVTSLLDNARDEFAANKTPRPFQIVVEEAHNLFERNKRDTDADPWVRLSKEAAKYKVGMLYATQEVSSVDQRVLSNTSNWLVGHLNSDNETKELSHYYDFKTWADSIRRCEDVGFVRMKTYSGKYIIPAQVAKFDHQMINEARKEAGLDAVTVEDL
ncbi:ATP-binding protein [Mycolicibacterium sp. 120270]|uniref:ATP-binding protein n=1 Tax=Mycolicibacterium sp. 120270 TaxID=3090600 RepID=UPI00299D0B7E|nr:DUF87 domain-containing protein [Mycolicibacterium sp. 120270]MDX1887920.1 DUF87 domain-containing protein [Mycolicibacterium sp. 120270]